MKILLLNDYATPTGGAEILTLALRDGLRVRGHDARILASSAQPLPVKNQADYHCFGTTSGFRTLLQSGNPWAVLRLHQVLAEFQPDVVHVTLFLTQLSPFILPLLKDVPSLYYAVWYRSVCPLGTKMLPDETACQMPMGKSCYNNHCLPLRDWLPLMFQMQLWKRWHSTFNKFVAASDAVKQRLIEAGINPVEVVWHGVPIQPQRPPLTSTPTVAFAARLVKEKGASVLLQAFAKVVIKLPEAQLLLVGDGPKREYLLSQIAQMNLATNVLMPGQLPRHQMEELFATAWVQVVPSLWAEPFGLITVNAMMRGTAIVATATGGSVDIVRHELTGSLVSPGDVEALAEALLRVLQDRELAEKMGKMGREIAIAQFSEDRFVDTFIKLYRNLCENKVHII